MAPWSFRGHRPQMPTAQRPPPLGTVARAHGVARRTQQVGGEGAALWESFACDNEIMSPQEAGFGDGEDLRHPREPGAPPAEGENPTDSEDNEGRKDGYLSPPLTQPVRRSPDGCLGVSSGQGARLALSGPQTGTIVQTTLAVELMEGTLWESGTRTTCQQPGQRRREQGERAWWLAAP